MTTSAERKYRVMHLVESLEVGGMENGVVNLAKGIDKARFDFSVCCLSHPGTLCNKLDADQVPVFALGWGGGVTSGLFFRLARLIREQRADVVHTHGWLTLFYGSIASLFAGRPALINGEHGTFHLDNLRRKAAYRLLSPLVRRYVAVSYSLEGRLKEMLGEGGAVTCIPNGVDLGKFQPLDRELRQQLRAAMGIPPGAVVVGSVGRLESVKNFKLLLEAFARLKRPEGEVHCLLVGDGALREELSRLAVGLEVAERVHFTGKVDNPHQVTPLIDVFVSSSLSEGMSNTILEAMACGLPVVATDVGDSGRLVEQGGNGFMVPSNDPDAMEKALDRLVCNDGLRRGFGERSRGIAEAQYDLAKMVLRYEEMYLQSVDYKKGEP